jgi:hypothetical protein
MTGITVTQRFHDRAEAAVAGIATAVLQFDLAKG